MKQHGGQILGLSVDAPELSRRLIEEQELPFRILSDPERVVLSAYGLTHAGAGPDGETIAVPAQLLVGPDATILWRHVARRITDRPSPKETLEAIEELLPVAPR